MGVAYDGSAFQGWQLQHEEPTVQLAVEKALSRVADHPVRVHCAGRTDTGVHAAGQVIHFHSDADRPVHAWVLGGNANLPGDVSMLWARDVDPQFHARFSATGRRYRYVIWNRWTRPALDRRRLAWWHYPLDERRMAEGARYLLGEHDFTSFRAVACQAKHAVREIREISVWRDGDRVLMEVAANAFLHHMVRNIAGTLIAVGQGEREPAWVKEVLDSRDRGVAGITAPASGLCFQEVEYPERFGIPRGAGPAFPQR